jgi:hypothetical protein
MNFVTQSLLEKNLLDDSFRFHKDIERSCNLIFKNSTVKEDRPFKFSEKYNVVWYFRTAVKW